MQPNENVSPHFTELLEALLEGQAICAHRHPRLHRTLHNSEISDRRVLEEILSLLARRLEVTNDIFYAVHIDRDETVLKRAEAVFREYLQEVNRNVEFFDIVRTARGGEALEVGDRFTLAELLHSIMQDRQLADRLLKLTAEETQMKDPPPDQALRRMLDDMGRYLYPANREQLEYVVTGEYELFNQWFEFVADKEGFDLDALEGDEAEGKDDTRQALLL